MGASVALLRGINVGGHRRVPMDELRDAVTAAGFTDVRTYIQSGNLLFGDPPAEVVDPAATIVDIVTTRFGFTIDVVCRTCEEMTAILETNPLLATEDDPTKLHVMFLDDVPEPDRAGALDPDRSPRDRFVLVGRELYLHHPDGAAASKFTADYVARTLDRTVTARNWKTVDKLVALLAAT